jgi:anti-anti-sigma factor
MAARQLGRPDLVRTNRDWPKLDLQTCVTGSAVLPTVATVADRDGVTLVTISRHDHPIPADSGPLGASTVVVIDGDVDGDTGCLLRSMLEEALDERSTVYCDLSRAGFFGAAGANALLAAQRRARALGRTVVLRGVHGTAEMVLAVTGLDGIVVLRDGT